MSRNNYKNIAPTQIDYQSVCGIDALYFYIKVGLVDYTDFYHNQLLRGVIESQDFELISKDYNNQFTYFRHFGNIGKIHFNSEGSSPLQEICKIGFKNLNERDNLDSIIIQMTSDALQQMKITDIKDYFRNLINSFGMEVLKFQCSRVDLNTHVFDFDFSWLSYDFFSTKLKKNSTFENGSKLETFTLGSRGNGLYLRIYDKLKQLNTLEYLDSTRKEYLIGAKYIAKYIKVPDYKSIWNIELEVRREQLRTYKIDTLDDLDSKINSFFHTIFNKTIRLLQEKKTMISNDNRIPTHSVWSHIINDYDYNGFPLIELDKEKQKQYKRDKIWLRNRITEFLLEEKNDDFYLREEAKKFLDYLDQYTDIKNYVIANNIKSI